MHRPLETLSQDLRFALRQLRRAPAFAIVAIVTLALAIGVSAAVYSVLDATIVRPLPYDHPEKIVSVRTWSPQGYTQPASWLEYRDWRRENHTLAALASYNSTSANLESTGTALPVRAVEGSDNFFQVFGVQPLLGRTYAAGEDQPGRNDVAVLSYELWRQSFGGDPAAVGRSVRVDGAATTVIGVMPAGFRFPLSVGNALYRPLHLARTLTASRGSHFLPTVARLRDDVTPQQAQADMTRVFTDQGRQHPDEAGRRARLIPYAQASLGSTAGPLLVLTLAVGGVLLVGCVNVAGLLLARGVRRQRELGLRFAIGADRTRVVRQLLTESLLLSTAGAAFGVALAALLLVAIRQLLVAALSRGADVSLNLPVLAVTVLVAIATGLAAGLLPALRAARTAPTVALAGGGAAGTTRQQTRLRSGLITVQVAVALGLLVCSGLLLRNLHGLRTRPLGFDPDHLLTEELQLSSADYQSRNLLTSFYAPLLERVRATPGVVSAGYINLLPIAEYGSNSDVSIVGKPPAPRDQETLAENRSITPGTLETLGAHLVSGRPLNDAEERQGGPLHLVVNQAFVRKFFSPGENPLGQLILWGHEKCAIVGVYSDIRQNLAEPALPEMDLDITQIPPDYAASELLHLRLVLRTAGDPAVFAPTLGSIIRQVDRGVPFRPALTMQQVVSETLTFERLESWLFAIFAGLSLTLLLAGIYGMAHHEVELRTRDTGVRMALGASRARVMCNLLVRFATLMAIGLAVGWALTLALERVLASVVQLDVGANALLLAAITCALALFGVAASLLPARRAASINPVEALRAQ